MSFDFGDAVGTLDAYTPPIEKAVREGNYVMKCVEVENTLTKSDKHYPLLKLKWESVEGAAWENMVISPNEFSVQKLLNLIQSLGLPAPVPGTDIDPATGKLSDEYANKILGKSAGVLVRDKTEKDNRQASPTRGQDITRPRINGYCTPDKLAGRVGATGSPSGNPVASRKDEDIPF